MLLSPQELQAISALNEAVGAVRELLQQRLDQERWIDLDAAANLLGDITRKWLLVRIRDGRFRYGKEFIDTSDGDRPNYLVNVAAIRKYLQTPPEKRQIPTIRRAS